MTLSNECNGCKLLGLRWLKHPPAKGIVETCPRCEAQYRIDGLPQDEKGKTTVQFTVVRRAKG
jgi:hypothetical protein